MPVQPPRRPGPQRGAPIANPTKQVTKGAIHAVPCPWCGRPNDFRPLAGDQDGGVGWGSQGLERGAVIDCDHCKHKSRIMAIETVTIIKLVAVR